MKKSYLIIATAATFVLAGCSSEDYTGEEIVEQVPVKEVAIDFGSHFKAITRTDSKGEAAATLLNKQFIVSGFKGDQSKYVTDAPTLATDPAKSVLVFDNFQVNWEENTANTSASNTSNWEYVGYTPVAGMANIQKIKYWDFGTKQYDFIAYSLGNNKGTGTVTASAITPSTLKTSAYTLTGSGDNLKNCYIADLITVKKDDYESGPVTIRFRNLSTKVRIALYETVPGYAVKNVKFYNSATAATPSTDATLFSEGKFFSTEGTYTIYYPTLDAAPGDANYDDNNIAHVKYSGSTSNQGLFGKLDYNNSNTTLGEKVLGETSSSATYAGNSSDAYYTIVLPNEDGAPLNLRVDFTLISDDGLAEEITVSGATAQVPATYAQWQAGTAYTYIFKISKDTNGTTGTPGDPTNPYVPGDPKGLYPITFDAVVVDNVNVTGDIQETITTVATPSITTYSRGEIVTWFDEYYHNNDIFATVSEGNALATLTGKAALYEIPDGNTEAEILSALQMRQLDRVPDGVTIVGRNGVNMVSSSLLSLTNKYMGPDNVERTVGTDEVAKFKPTEAKTYAFVYTQTPSYYDMSKYEKKSFGIGTSVKGYWCNYEYVEQANMDAVPYQTYFTKETSTETFTEVPAADYPFCGESANSLYKKVGSYYQRISSTTEVVHTGTVYATGGVAVSTGQYKVGESATGLYTDAAHTTPATGTIASGTTYYDDNGDPVTVGDYKIGESAAGLYTKSSSGTYYYAASGTIAGGITYYTMASPQIIPYTAFNTSLYKSNGTGYEAVTETKPDVLKTYYQKTGSTYTRVYILPQRTDGYYLRIDHDSDIYYACPAGETALAGRTYYDRYVVNNGVYAVKVIKVQ